MPQDLISLIASGEIDVNTGKSKKGATKKAPLPAEAAAKAWGPKAPPIQSPTISPSETLLSDIISGLVGMEGTPKSALETEEEYERDVPFVYRHPIITSLLRSAGSHGAAWPAGKAAFGATLGATANPQLATAAGLLAGGATYLLTNTAFRKTMGAMGLGETPGGIGGAIGEGIGEAAGDLAMQPIAAGVKKVAPFVFRPKISIAKALGTPVPEQQLFDPLARVRTETGEIIEQAKVPAIEGYNRYGERLKLTAGQTTGSQFALAAETEGAGLAKRLAEQEATSRTIAQEISGISPGVTKEGLGTKLQEKALGKTGLIEGRLAEFKRQKQQISERFNQVTREVPTYETTKIKGPDGKPLILQRVQTINGPVDLKRTNKYAQQVVSEIRPIIENPNTPQDVKRQLAHVLGNIEPMAKGDVISFDELDRIRSVVGESLGNGAIVKNYESRRLKELYSTISGDIREAAYAVDASTGAIVEAQQHKSLGKELSDYLEKSSEFLTARYKTRTGKLLQKEADPKNLVTTISGSMKEFKAAQQLLGSKNANQALTQYMLETAIDPRTGGYNGTKLLNQLRTHREKLHYAFDSKQRSALTDFAHAMVMQNRQTGVGKAMTFSGEGVNMIDNLGTGALRAAASGGSGATGARGAFQASVLFIASPYLGKLFLDPDFARMSAKMSEASPSNPATWSRIKAIMGIAARHSIPVLSATATHSFGAPIHARISKIADAIELFNPETGEVVDTRVNPQKRP